MSINQDVTILNYHPPKYLQCHFEIVLVNQIVCKLVFRALLPFANWCQTANRESDANSKLNYLHLFISPNTARCKYWIVCQGNFIINSVFSGLSVSFSGTQFCKALASGKIAKPCFHPAISISSYFTKC